MTAITISDLPTNLALDRKALTSLRGGGAPWVFGWIVPYAPQSASFAPTVNNFIQTNNYIGQLVDQSQTLAISSVGNGSTITAVMIGSPSNAGQ
jgi:hypothetical protein